jgi:hypothetical protein
LDTAFDGDGKVTTDVGPGDIDSDQISALLILPDGDILAVGITWLDGYRTALGRYEEV